MLYFKSCRNLSVSPTKDSFACRIAALASRSGAFISTLSACVSARADMSSRSNASLDIKCARVIASTVARTTPSACGSVNCAERNCSIGRWESNLSTALELPPPYALGADAVSAFADVVARASCVARAVEATHRRMGARSSSFGVTIPMGASTCEGRHRARRPRARSGVRRDRSSDADARVARVVVVGGARGEATDDDEGGRRRGGGEENQRARDRVAVDDAGAWRVYDVHVSVDDDLGEGFLGGVARGARGGAEDFGHGARAGGVGDAGAKKDVRRANETAGVLVRRRRER